MSLGSTPATAAATNFPRMGRPSFLATERRVRRTAEAPSETWNPRQHSSSSKEHRNKDAPGTRYQREWIQSLRTQA